MLYRKPFQETDALEEEQIFLISVLNRKYLYSGYGGSVHKNMCILHNILCIHVIKEFDTNTPIAYVTFVLEVNSAMI
jgi:hypothetical protein